jgi:hypothetical protein
MRWNSSTQLLNLMYIQTRQEHNEKMGQNNFQKRTGSEAVDTESPNSNPIRVYLKKMMTIKNDLPICHEVYFVAY